MKSHGIWRIRARNWAVGVGVSLLAGLWLAAVAASWADAAENSSSNSSASSEDEEYNFNWLDPEKKIYVLQNRRYLKANRPMLSVMVGPGMSNPYRNTFNADFRAAYYVTESFGIETFYSVFRNSENNTYEALTRAAGNTLPVVRNINSQFGFVAHYVPWYAKINVFNNILYFDWYFSGGAGSMNTQLDTRRNAAAASAFVEESRFALYLGTGHQYHLSNRLTLRLDFMGAFYRGLLFGTSGDESWYSNYTFGVGFGLRL